MGVWYLAGNVVLYEERQAVLSALYTITCSGGLVMSRGRGLAEYVHGGVDEDVDEVVGGNYPDETCGRLTGPAQTAFLSF